MASTAKKRSSEPWSDLAGEVIVQAMEDIKLLAESGIVKKGRCVERWPKTRLGKCRRFGGEYRTRGEVEALIEFFYGKGLGLYLDFSACEAEPCQVRRAAGLPETRPGKGAGAC